MQFHKRPRAWVQQTLIGCPSSNLTRFEAHFESVTFKNGGSTRQAGTANAPSAKEKKEGLERSATGPSRNAAVRFRAWIGFALDDSAAMEQLGLRRSS